MPVTVKCVSKRLNHITFETVDGVKKAHRIAVGDTFTVKSVPKEWDGLVVIVDDGKPKRGRPSSAVTNPKDSASAEAAKAAAAEA